jgi:optic atrophy 3 protein
MSLALKIGTLILRTLSKPVSKYLAEQAQDPGSARDLCHRFGQRHHRIETQLTLKLKGHHADSIKPLEEAKAVTLGSTILSEAFVFLVGASCVSFEFIRKTISDNEKAARKEALEEQRRQDIERRFKSIEAGVEGLLYESRLEEDNTRHLITQLGVQVDSIKHLLQPQAPLPPALKRNETTSSQSVASPVSNSTVSRRDKEPGIVRPVVAPLLFDELVALGSKTVEEPR